MNHSIDYFEKQHQHLYNYMVNLTGNVLSLEKIFVELIACIQQFSRGLQGIAEKLHTHISEGNESDTIVSCQQLMSNNLLRLSQTWENVGSSIQTEVNEPFQQFVGNFRGTNRALNQEQKTQLDEIKSSRAMMVKCQEEYWKLMKNSEEQSSAAQKMVDQIERGEKTKEDFQKQISLSVRMQETAEEAEKDYKKFVQITNDKWRTFQQEWDRIFLNVGLNEQSRINFSKQTIQQLVRILVGEELGNLEAKETVPVKQLIEKKMEQNNLKNTFRLEEFQPYEEFKKQQTPETCWQIVGDELTKEERRLLDLYLASLFVQDSNDKSQAIISIKQLLQKQSGRQYFIDQLQKLHQKSISEKQTTFYLNLGNEQFNELAQLMRHWINYVDLNNCYDCEEIYNLLSRSIRIVKMEANYKVNLAQQLGELPLWQRVDKWSELYFYISAKKVDEKKRQAQSLYNETQNNIVRKGFKFIGKGFQLIKNLGQQQQQQFNINETEISYLILEDINLFITSLKLPSDLSSDIIFQIAFQQQHFDKEHIVKLLEKQEDLHNSQWKKLFKQGKVQLTNKIEKFERRKLFNYELKCVQVVNYSLKYLEIKDKPEKLLLISNTFNKLLKPKIFKFYMISLQNQEKIRLHYINCILNLQNSPIDYVKMKVEIGIEIDINKQNYEETIALDVQRSLHIHKNKISTSVLQSLLRIYAYYNQDVGYCQGMNYIAGFLYLTFNDEIQAYKAFDKVMNMYFKDMYINDFQKLKCAFYSFDRLLCIFLPELASHFKDQKIDASYYVASWMITMFSNVFQYTMHSALLNIIWDIFLVEGWKGFYKCTFYIFSLLQSTILQLEFDEILHFLGKLIKDDLFQIEDEEKLKECIGLYQDPPKNLKIHILTKFRISNRILRSLEQEYNCFQLKFNKKLSQYMKS